MFEIKKVGIYIFPQVEELDFVGVYEILAKTRSMKNEGKLPIETSLQVDILASEELITCANGLMIKPHLVTDTFEGYDLLIIPGGKGVNQLIENKQVLKNIENFTKNNIICSVCTGSLVLGAAGLLKGKKAATHHESRDTLREYCDVTNLRVYRDGNIISTGGISCSLDLGLKVLELVYGKDISEMVADRLELPLEMRNFE